MSHLLFSDQVYGRTWAFHCANTAALAKVVIDMQRFIFIEINSCIRAEIEAIATIITFSTMEAPARFMNDLICGKAGNCFIEISFQPIL